MLIGFVLLLTSVTADPIPVSERIYPDKAACEKIQKRLLGRRPNVQFECAPVHR